jgi:hypothetical protein
MLRGGHTQAGGGELLGVRGLGGSGSQHGRRRHLRIGVGRLDREGPNERRGLLEGMSRGLGSSWGSLGQSGRREVSWGDAPLRQGGHWRRSLAVCGWVRRWARRAKAEGAKLQRGQRGFDTVTGEGRPWPALRRGIGSARLCVRHFE